LARPEPPAPQLDLDARKGRYGVVYMEAMATAAGFDLMEPKPGADMLAYDAALTFPEGHVRVQIKTTHRYEIDGTNERLTYTANQGWVDSWASARCPVYFLVVVVPHSLDDDVSGAWLNHHPTGTDMLRTAAYWSRVDASQFNAANMSVAALRSQRFDSNTFAIWRRNLIDAYRPVP